MNYSIQRRSDRLAPANIRGNDGAGDPGSSDEVSLSDLIRVLRRRRRIISASVIVFFLLGAFFCIVKARRYEALADLAVNPEGSNSMDMGDITASLGAGGLGFDEKLETQVRILKSDSLAWTVASELRLDKQPTFAGNRKFYLWGPYVVRETPPDQIEQTGAKRRHDLLQKFSKSLTVQTIPRTQAVEITFRDADPALAREVVNHLTSAYTRRTFMTRYEDTMKASDWLSGQLAQLKSAVEESQAKLSKFQKQTGIFGTDENNNLVLSKLDDLSKELTDAESDRILKEAKYKVAKSGNPELIGTIVPDSVLPVLRSQEADVKNQLAQARSEFGPRYSKVIQLENQLAEVEKSLQKEVADIQERFHTDYQVSADSEKQMRAALDHQKQQAYDMADGLDQYGILKREVESGSDLYEDLLKKLKEAGVVASLNAANVDIIDPPALPTEPVEPKIPLVLALSMILGSGAGIVLAFVAENLDSVIRNPEEIEILTGIPLVGIVPHVKSARVKGPRQKGELETERPRQNALICLLRPNSQASEAFRTLRTSLLLASAGTPPRTILVSSAIPGEGKSFTSMNIASVLTQLGARVLLVDADMRRGLVAERLNLAKNFGLSGSLTGAGNWRDAVASLPEEANLFVLQAGAHPPNSAELVASTQMHALIEEWREEYDHVVIDTPPVLIVTDAVLMAQKADAVILVSRIAVTSRQGLRRASELLQSGNARVTGIVANDAGAAESYYGYGYGKYTGYYSEDSV